MNLHETSAKTGHGVEDMLNDVLSQVYKLTIRPQILQAIDGNSAANSTHNTTGAAQTTNPAVRDSFPLGPGWKNRMKRDDGEREGAAAAGCCS